MLIDEAYVSCDIASQCRRKQINYIVDIDVMRFHVRYLTNPY